LRIQGQVDFNDVKGELILVPVQNPVGYLFRSRLNPYDPIDPDWVHPGESTGSFSKRMKHILNTLASEADCVIDMHSAGRGGSNNPMIYAPPEIGNRAGTRSLELSIAFGGDRIIQGDKEEDYGWPVQFAMPFVAVREGRAGIYPEAGQGGSGLPEDSYVEYFVTGVLNVMKAMGMLDGEIFEQGERLVVDPLKDGTQTVRTVNGGIFNPVVDNGDSVTKEQLLAEVHSIPKGIEEIKAPIDGLVIFIRTYGSIEAGGHLISISPSKT
jgi:predicted deacylase